MRRIKTTTTDYLFQSTLYLISALCCDILVRPRSSGGGEDRGRTVGHTKTLKARLSLALPPFSMEGDLGQNSEMDRTLGKFGRISG